MIPEDQGRSARIVIVEDATFLHSSVIAASPAHGKMPMIGFGYFTPAILGLTFHKSRSECDFRNSLSRRAADSCFA